MIPTILTFGLMCLNFVVMDKKICSNKVTFTDDELEKCSKEELINKIKSLTAHNLQLKNLLNKANKSPQCNELKESKPFDFTKCQFRHIALKILYLGWDYRGFVVQEDTSDTVENHLFNALLKTKLIQDRSSSNYHRCGRTDKGVSAFSQVISINVRSILKDEKAQLTNEINYCKILNKVLPDNIQCVAWSPADQNFSARFNCKSRTYRYYFPRGKLNVQKMKEASNKLLGTHDFRNFCKMDVGNGVVKFIRHILEINIAPVTTEFGEYSMYVIKIRANAFLWHQIRCIMGILLLIGLEREDTTIIDELLNIEKHPRKPDYSMASEVPLNLFTCEYDNLIWQYDQESLKIVLQKLQKMWLFHAIKETMTRDMLTSLQAEYCGDTSELENNLSDNLLPSIKMRKHKPLLKRQTCDSLEDRMKHFTKRKRIFIKTDDENK